MRYLVLGHKLIYWRKFSFKQEHLHGYMPYTGWPRKNATPTINNFKKTRDRMKKLCALLRVEFFFFQHDDTKIIDFDEGVLILWPSFWGNVIFKICHFCLNYWLPKIFHCMASPGKVSALALKNEDSMNKEKHSLCNFAVLQSGGATQRNSSLPQSWLLIRKKQILKMTLPQKTGIKNQNAFIKIIHLSVILLEKLFSTHSCTHYFELVPN